MDREEIESRLWEYIDSTCGEADKNRIAALIATDAVWMQEYNELMVLHTGISGNLELEQPSMRFAKDVMDNIAKTNIAPAAKQYINKGVIKGIAAFFIVVIISLIGYSFATADWHSTANLNIFSKIPFDASGIFNSTFVNIFIMVNIVLALVLLDKLLRRRNTKHLTN
jgi:hypothetical protein